MPTGYADSGLVTKEPNRRIIGPGEPGSLVGMLYSPRQERIGAFGVQLSVSSTPAAHFG
jgi:hypothetical protein